MSHYEDKAHEVFHSFGRNTDHVVGEDRIAAALREAAAMELEAALSDILTMYESAQKTPPLAVIGRLRDRARELREGK